MHTSLKLSCEEFGIFVIGFSYAVLLIVWLVERKNIEVPGHKVFNKINILVLFVMCNNWSWVTNENKILPLSFDLPLSSCCSMADRYLM